VSRRYTPPASVETTTGQLRKRDSPEQNSSPPDPACLGRTQGWRAILF
jgi:hypothetical protein